MKTLYTNGKIYLEKGRFAKNFLVEGDTILAVDTQPGQEDQVVDLGGRTVLPGLNDSHLHIVQKGENLSRVNLHGTKSIEEIIQRCKEFLEENPSAKKYLYGRGWNQDYFTSGEKRVLNRHDLDKISTETPIVLERVCGHILATNTKAIEELGITEDTVIEGGEIRRDEKGVPTGEFTENALAFPKSLAPKDTRQEHKAKILAGLNYAISKGLTSIQSCDYYEGTFKDTVEEMLEIYRNKECPLRYEAQFNFQSIEPLKEYLALYHNREDIYDETYTKGSWKLFKDGSLGARTAELLEDYADDPGNRGVAAISAQKMDEYMAFAEKEGLRVLTHVIGDGALQSVMDAYINHMEEGNPKRHGLVHCQITRMDQIEEMGKNNILGLVQPIFLDYDISIVQDRVGKELAQTSYAFKSLYKEGANLVSLGTDCPVEDLNPFQNIYHAVSRKRLDGTPKEGYNPQEALSLEEAIDAYTLGSAYCQGMENRKGRIKEGYLADFILLDKDIFSLAEEEIKDLEVQATYIGGEKVYEKK